MALTKAGNIVLKYPHRKNLIINGNFDIWQRGTSFVGAAAGAFSADRWRRGSANDSVVTLSAGTHNAILGSRLTKYALGVSVTTADTSISAAQYESQIYNIEGYDVQQIMGQTVTLSFWVYSSLPGTYCVAFRSIAPTYRSYIAEYTINQANTSEYKTITFTMDNGSVGTWDYENGTGLSIFFMLACGTNLQSTANSWQTANVIATSNQVNFLSATSRAFFLYQVQLELGPVATPFENRPIGEELALCQRYCQVFGAYDGGFGCNFNGYAQDANIINFVVQFTQQMRSYPAFSFSAANHFVAQFRGSVAAPTAITMTERGVTSGYFQATGLSGLTAGEGVIFRFGNTLARLTFDAEL